jgi:hypothetical protein
MKPLQNMSFYNAFVLKSTFLCKHRFIVQVLKNPPFCSSTIFAFEWDYWSAYWNLYKTFVVLLGFILIFATFGVDQIGVFYQGIRKRS